MTEAPSQGTSSLAIDLELVHVGFEEDEGPEVSLLSRSHQTKGPVVVMTEISVGEVIERQTTSGDFLSAPVSIKVVSSSSLQC